jgi:hypothetical protein
MSAIMNDAYKELVAGWACGKGSLPSLTIHLFTNNVTFGDSTTSGLTEASGSGYSSIAVAPSTWTLSTTTGNGISTQAGVTFTLTGSFTFYGWYATDNNNGNAYVMGETWSSSVVFGGGGGTLQLNLVLDVLDN